eukprot:TRINITY_DN32634_c0_g1_i1.p1 TRINITY_DN32634_c0_g1~~TRINITY_DN32634_c0_g1_i1.p1  ORF type:complete len:112 (-),score=7.44 TRINITY_DN32634_c0_g1_i1:20-355(-)
MRHFKVLSACNLFSSMFLQKILNQSYVLTHSIVLLQSLLIIPGIPLGLPFQVQHAGLLSIAITKRSLFEESIHFLQLIISKSIVHNLKKVVSFFFKLASHRHSSVTCKVSD